jgi:hypothetical protein
MILQLLFGIGWVIAIIIAVIVVLGVVTHFVFGRSFSDPQGLAFRRKKANRLAKYLLRHGSDVEGVELFGSLSRGEGGQYSDYDLIVCVDGIRAAEWMNQVRDAVDGDLYDASVARLRQHFALKLIGLTERDVAKAVGIRRDRIDIFVFPTDWRARLHELQEFGDHIDPDFMWNIAEDAIAYDAHSGFPFRDVKAAIKPVPPVPSYPMPEAPPAPVTAPAEILIRVPLPQQPQTFDEWRVQSLTCPDDHAGLLMGFAGGRQLTREVLEQWDAESIGFYLDEFLVQMRGEQVVDEQFVLQGGFRYGGWVTIKPIVPIPGEDPHADDFGQCKGCNRDLIESEHALGYLCEDCLANAHAKIDASRW